MRNPRTWMWIALVLQCGGMAYDFAWHGLLHPEFEASTAEDMARHLRSVHLPLYLGVLGMFVATLSALVSQLRRSGPERWVLIAFAGSVVQMVGESWHAYSHLQLETHSGPIAFTVSFIGLLIVVCALALGRRHSRLIGSRTNTEAMR